MVVEGAALEGDEQEFEGEEGSSDVEADQDGEDEEEDEVEPSSNPQNVFDDDDSGDDDDFTAALKLDIDPERAIRPEALDDINEDDLSYDDFDSTLKADIPMLDQELQTGNVQPGKDAHSQALQLGSSVELQRVSFQSLANADDAVEDKDENDMDSISQDQDMDSDQMDEMALNDNDMVGTSNSQLSNDTHNEQEGDSSGSQGRDWISYRCSGCGSRRKTHRCPRRASAGEMESPGDSSLSPDGTSPSSEVLEKTETSARPDRRDKASAERLVKVEVRETTKAVSARSMLSRAQSGSGVPRLKFKMSSQVSMTTTKEVSVTKVVSPKKEQGEASLKVEQGQMPASLMAIKEAPTTAKGLLATAILAGFRVRYMDRHGKVCPSSV